MSRQRVHKRYPVAAMLLLAGLAMLALAVRPSGVAAVTLDEAVDGQQLLCRMLGSHPEPPVSRTAADGSAVVQLTCHGGLLDGVTCDLVPQTDAAGTVTSSCYDARLPEPIHVEPGAGVGNVSDDAPGEPEGVGDIAVDPEVAEDPTRGDPDQPGFSVDEIVSALTDGCGHLGGEDVEIDRAGPDAPPGSIDVRCVGGPRYDLCCTVAVESLTCRWLEPAAEATVDVVVTGVNVVGRGPTPAVGELVDTPAPPTSTAPMDDDNGRDPTPPPTFTAPGNVGDHRAPTGGVAEEPPTGGPIFGGGDEIPPVLAPTVPPASGR